MSELHPSAREELNEAVLYYADISTDLAEKFILDFEQTLSFVEAMPLAWALYFSDLRKLNFKVFPFSIVYYLTEKQDIIILAIQHQSRMPFYWKDRR